MVGNDQHGDPIFSENVFTEGFKTEMRVSVPPHKTGKPRAKVRRGTLRK